MAAVLQAVAVVVAVFGVHGDDVCRAHAHGCLASSTTATSGMSVHV